MRLSFEKLRVWQISLDYGDACYALAAGLPAVERYNLAEQLRRAATSIGLSIAEGSIGRTRRDQARYLGYAIGSLAETVAAIRLMERRSYAFDPETHATALATAEKLLAHLTAFRRTLLPRRAEGSR